MKTKAYFPSGNYQINVKFMMQENSSQTKLLQFSLVLDKIWRTGQTGLKPVFEACGAQNVGKN